MDQQELAVCYCIIGHPQKAKFLAISHSDGWMPPTLRFPPGPVDFRAHMINEGMLRKYGLRTRVLRSLLQLPLYHCVELEIPAGGTSKKLKAVWVGREEYQRFRTDQKGLPDPFLRWLDEKESGQVPALRPQWQLPGFSRSAENWIGFQVDRLGLHLNGEIEQVRAGSGASCILRASVHNAWVYFKAGRQGPAGEAAITEVLAEQWPSQVVRPLVADAKRNWMLNEDFRPRSEGNVPAKEPEGSYAKFAESLAVVQAGSAKHLDEWESLALPRHGLDYLLQIIGRKSALTPRLQEGGGALSAEALAGFSAAMDAAGERCRRLAAFGLPDMLVHTDFRDDSMVLKDGCHYVCEWADAVIAHPFMSLSRMFEQAEAVRGGRGRHIFAGSEDKDVLHSVIEAYLQPFTSFADLSDLRAALDEAKALFPLWRFSRLLHAFEWTEIASPAWISLVVRLQNDARAMLPAR